MTVWEDAIGPLLTSAQARLLLGGLSPEGLSKKVKAGRVMRLNDEGGRVRYPAWQFDPVSAVPYPVVAELVSRYKDAGLDGWMLASFCVTPQPELEQRRPAEAFANHADASSILTAAERALAVLSE